MALRPEEIQMRFNMLPPELQKGVLPNDQAGMQRAVELADAQATISKDPQNPAVKMKDTLEQSVNSLQQMENGIMPEKGSGMGNNTMAKGKVFNLRKYAQTPPGTPSAVPSTPATTPADPFNGSPADVGGEQTLMQTNPSNENKFTTHEQLSQTLDGYGSVENTQIQNPDLVQAISGNQTAQDSFDRYFSEENEENRLGLAKLIYDNLPNNMKNQQVDTSNPSDGMTIQAPYKQGGTYAEYLHTVTAAIQEVAEKVGKSCRQNKQAQVFNLKKYAQHQTEQNVILWGPGQSRPDPFLRGQPVSDWHILERNKGFGGDIDGFWGVDWEAVWRGNVMDKYSRPYRDTETGEWVGGYIQKRFEVDKNIPVANNYQLLPGERRRPILPEYGVTEARLQSMRHANDGDLGKVYNNTSAPFNWRKAQDAKAVKTSEMNVKVAEEDKLAQLDVTTEKQLQNAAKRPGVLGLPSIQRHQQNPPEGKEGSGYVNNYGDEIEDKSAAVKKKSKQDGRTDTSVKTSWLNEGRPLKDLELKPLTMIGEKPNTDVIKDTDHYCPRCGSQLKGNDGSSAQGTPTKCPNCFFDLNSDSSDSGHIAPSTPDAPKSPTPTPGTNVVLNQVLFDSRTGKFIVADSYVEHPENAFMDDRDNRKRMFPDMKDLPRVNENIPSKEFKQFIDPNSEKRRRKVDNVTKSCTDLAIDG